MSERLTIRTPQGAALIIEATNEEDAKHELMEKYKLAMNKLADLEDKQTPQPPEVATNPLKLIARNDPIHYYCPGCGQRLFRVRNGHDFNPRYCEICGQAIDWKEVIKL